MPETFGGLHSTAMGVPDMRALVAARIASREWWLLLSARSGLPIIQAIEQEYYVGERQDDFDLHILPVPGVAFIAYCRKRRMTAAQLARIIEAWSGLVLDPAAMGEQDVYLLRKQVDADVLLAAAVLIFGKGGDG